VWFFHTGKNSGIDTQPNIMQDLGCLGREDLPMRHGHRDLRMRACLLLMLLVIGCQRASFKRQEETSVAGPQSIQARGEQRVLMVAVRFPGTEPSLSLGQIEKKVTEDLNAYVKEQSYGLAWLKADFKGWINLPDSIDRYKISPHNYQVDRTRVRKLIEDTMTALGKEMDFSRYQHILVIPGVLTRPGSGYGMICYCANPGMLTGVKGNIGYAVLKSKWGPSFQGGVFVGAENAHLGMYAHDFFHALGGIQNNRRLVPCLYDFDLQSDTSKTPSFENHAIYMGPWDIMSQHFVSREEGSPGLSSFTKIRLGWISSAPLQLAHPAETACAFLSPLSKSGNKLVLKIPLKDGQYYLVENRQPLGYDRALPDSGILILKVNPRAEEGTGTVRVMSAGPQDPNFSQATYRLDNNRRNLFIDKENKIALIPLWSEQDQGGVLFTTPEKSGEALKGAILIQRLLNRTPEPRSPEANRSIRDCMDAFKRFDFAMSIQMAEKALRN
jgi:M6 family metalloprotease-like protein